MRIVPLMSKESVFRHLYFETVRSMEKRQRLSGLNAFVCILVALMYLHAAVQYKHHFLYVDGYDYGWIWVDNFLIL